MLPWRLEEIKFGSKYNTWVIISAATHIIIFLVVIMIGQLSFSTFQNKILEIIKTETIEVELVTTTKNDTNIPNPIKTSEHHQGFVTRDEPESKSLPLPLPSEVTATADSAPKPVTPTEIKRYEQLLSKHFAVIMPRLPKDLQLPKKLYIWLKIDKHGDIYDYGFKPALTDQRTKDFLETAVSVASPVPAPPESEFLEDFMNYLIPLNFR